MEGSKKSKKDKKHSKRDREETGSAVPETSDLSFLLGGGEASSFDPGLASLFDASKVSCAALSWCVSLLTMFFFARPRPFP